MRLADVVDAYLTRQRSLGMRFESAGQLLRRFSRAMGDRPIQEVTPEAIIDFLNGNGVLTATWTLKHRVLTGLYRFAVSRGYVDNSPLPTTLPKLPPQQTPYVYSTDELRRLLDATAILRVGHSRQVPAMYRRLNEERPIRRLGVTRRKLLEEVDRPALKALPESPYVFAEWRICRVSIDYHVEVAAHYYSVPHRFVRTEVEVRFTARTVEIFHKGERIAVHQRMSGNHKHTTVPEHMASSHRRYAGWTIERIRKDAATIGPATAALCDLILDQRAHPEQGFRACLGILRLARSYGHERLDAAAMRAIDIGARTYGSVKSILANNLDRRPSPKRSADDAPILHPNIRGPRYYN